MRKHRHFAVMIVAVMGAGLLVQRSATALSPPTDTHRPVPHAAARPGALPVHVEAVSGRPSLEMPTDSLLALTVAVTKLTAPPPPPPPPPAAPPAPRPPAVAPAPATSPGGPWLELRQCESGDHYGENTGNGYYGAYQFSLSTWEALGYGGLPSAAPPAVQDQAAKRLEEGAGWGQWPVCARRLGLD